MSKRIYTFYQATRNSSGILKVRFRISSENVLSYVQDNFTSSWIRFYRYYPMKNYETILKTFEINDCLYYRTKEEAIDAYIRLEKSRIKDAQEAIKRCNAQVARFA